MSAGFQSQDLCVRTADGLNCYLTEEIVYIAKDGAVLKLPVGTYSNGASTPREMWSVLPPFGKYWMAAFLHDGAYDNMLQIQQPNGAFTVARLPKSQCDALLFEAMDSLGVTQEEKAAIYKAVDLFGQAYFNLARAEINGIVRAALLSKTNDSP
jgi:hypothetical protein